LFFANHTHSLARAADVGRIAGMSDHMWIDAVRPTWQGELVVTT
jgi:hypothetical protein